MAWKLQKEAAYAYASDLFSPSRTTQSMMELYQELCGR
jgi:hypothetical protein